MRGKLTARSVMHVLRLQREIRDDAVRLRTTSQIHGVEFSLYDIEEG